MGKEIYGGKYSLGKVDITVGLLRSFAVESYCVLYICHSFYRRL